MFTWSRLMPLLLDAVLAGAPARRRRFRLRILLAALAGLIAVMGLVMLVGAAFLRLAECMSASTAASIVGGGLLVTAGLIALTARLLRCGRSPNPAGDAAAHERTNGTAATIAALLSAAEAAIERDARSKTPHFAVMALLAGCAVGASPELRRVIAGLASR